MCLFFFFKQKTAYEMRISDWSSDVCSSDLPTDMVRVNYKGSLLDGTVFDDSSKHGGPAEIPLQQVVPGWQEGIALMPVGSKYKFWIPAKLGYGEKGTPGGPIPPNAPLGFEVDLPEIPKPHIRQAVVKGKRGN